MSLAIDITDGRGLNNEAHHYLMLKKSYVHNAVFAIHFSVKGLLPAVHY